MYLRIWSRRVLPWCAVLAWGGGLSCAARADELVQQALALVQQGQALQAFRLLDAQEAQRAGDPAYSTPPWAMLPTQPGSTRGPSWRASVGWLHNPATWRPRWRWGNPCRPWATAGA